MTSTSATFRHSHYVRHNARRMEHLVSLGLPLFDRTVLELGAGIGDLTTFFLDRNCKVTVVEGRTENVNEIQRTLGCEKKWRVNEDYSIHQVDLENPESFHPGKHEVVFNYGLLYHLTNPKQLLSWAAQYCTDMMICETCVSYRGDEKATNNTPEDAQSPTQAISGVGCRPTRAQVFEWMKECFPHVYLPKTQPRHTEFPLDWTLQEWPSQLTRAIFIGSRSALENETLFVQALPFYQEASR